MMSDDMVGRAAKGYGSASADNQAQPASGDIEIMVGRVSAIRAELLRAFGRVAAIADGVYGLQPQPAAQHGGEGLTPSGQLHRLGTALDELDEASNRLHQQIDRLDRL